MLYVLYVCCMVCLIHTNSDDQAQIRSARIMSCNTRASTSMHTLTHTHTHSDTHTQTRAHTQAPPLTNTDAHSHTLTHTRTHTHSLHNHTCRAALAVLRCSSNRFVRPSCSEAVPATCACIYHMTIQFCTHMQRMCMCLGTIHA
jgi:hypothetical protein